MKRFLSTVTIAVIGVVVLASAVRQGRATEYSFTMIHYPGAYDTFATGINDSGQIVGAYSDPSGAHAFIWSDEVYTSFDHPDATGEESGAWGVNSVGQIVGSYQRADGTYGGFLRDGVNYSELAPYEGSADTTPVGINDAGNVAGHYLDAGGVWRGFLFDGTSYTTFDDPDAVQTFARGINNAGVIVGEGWESEFPAHAFIREADGTFSTFIVSGYPAGARGINDLGQIVGEYGPSLDELYGFVLSGGIDATPVTLVPPGATRTMAHDINNLGQVVGWYWDASASLRSFLATPIPEPLTGDFNGNGLVEQADLDLVLSNWGSDGSPPPAGWIDDLPTGHIDQEELDRVLLNWGLTTIGPSAEGVPEPATLAAAVLAVVAGAAVRIGASRRSEHANPT